MHLSKYLPARIFFFLKIKIQILFERYEYPRPTQQFQQRDEVIKFYFSHINCWKGFFCITFHHLWLSNRQFNVTIFWFSRGLNLSNLFIIYLKSKFFLNMDWLGMIWQFQTTTNQKKRDKLLSIFRFRFSFLMNCNGGYCALWGSKFGQNVNFWFLDYDPWLWKSVSNWFG